MQTIQISKDTSNVIKGIACLLIVAHHFCARLMGKGYDDIIVNFIGLRGGVIAVTIFFFLSAWGLSESQSKNSYPLGKFVKRRLSKVYVPLMITNIVYYFFLLVYGRIDFYLSSFVLNALNIDYIDHVLWFCNTILIFYLIFYLSFLPRTKWFKILVCFVSTVIYCVLTTIVFPNSPFYVYSIVGFPFGMMCSLYKENMLKITHWGSWSIVALLFFFLGAMALPEYRNHFLMNSYCFILLVVLVAIIQRIDFSKKLIILPFVGLYSYEIYLIHNKVLDPLGDAGFSNWYPLAFLMIVIPLSILLNKFIKVVLK